MASAAAAQKMVSAVEGLRMINVGEPYVSLVDKRRGLKSLTRLFLSEPRGGQLPKFVIDNGE